MSNDKIKFYKNSDRNKTVAHTPYVPQYQQLGIEPEEYKNPLSPLGTHVTIVKPEPLPKDNPRVPRSVIRQSYAEAVASPIGRGKGPVPNVGNNMEHTWSSIDGEIIDDLTESKVDPNHEMIDNNDFVDMEVDAVSIISSEEEFTNKNFLTEEDLKAVIKEDNCSVFQSLPEGDCILMVNDIVICSGLTNDIEEQVRDLIFGEHKLYGGSPVDINNIVVLKKVKIKVGVFLE